MKLERQLATTAARAAGLTTTRGLDDFADRRAHPGGVRLDLEPDRETAEELADARNYLLWGLVPLHDRVLAGDSSVLDAYERRMRALVKVTEAWNELHTGAA